MKPNLMARMATIIGAAMAGSEHPYRIARTADDAVIHIPNIPCSFASRTAYFMGRGGHGKPRKTNRLHMARKAKHQRRRAAK